MGLKPFTQNVNNKYVQDVGHVRPGVLSQDISHNYMCLMLLSHSEVVYFEGKSTLRINIP